MFNSVEEDSDDFIAPDNQSVTSKPLSRPPSFSLAQKVRHRFSSRLRQSQADKNEALVLFDQLSQKCSFGPVLLIKAGTMVAVIKEQEGWVLCAATDSGKQGWVVKENLTSEKNVIEAASILLKRF